MISIITPVYNSEKYIIKTINSVQAQTYSNWQLILIDDCSTDSSASLIKTIAAKDDRIITLSTNKNSGPAHARNIGIQYALEHNSDYLSFLDSDDLFEPNFLEAMLRNALESNADITWCNYYSYMHNGNSTKQIIKHGLEYSLINDINISLSFFIKETNGLGSLCNKLYLTSFLQKHYILLNEDRVRAEDWEFNLMLFKHNPRIYAIPDVLYNYIHHDVPSVMSSFRQKDFAMYKRSLQLLEEIANDNNLPEKRNILYATFLYNSICYIVLAVLTNKDFELMKATCNDNILRTAVDNSSLYYRLTPKHKVYALLIKYKMYHFLMALIRIFK